MSKLDPLFCRLGVFLLVSSDHYHRLHTLSCRNEVTKHLTSSQFYTISPFIHIRSLPILIIAAIVAAKVTINKLSMKYCFRDRFRCRNRTNGGGTSLQIRRLLLLLLLVLVSCTFTSFTITRPPSMDYRR